jgi:hypothetical protein
MIEADSEAQERIGKRAQYERFTLVVCKNGIVNVRNDSYGEDNGEHIYSVDIEDESCTCPHATYRDAHCKHLTAVESRPIVVSSAEAAADSYSPVAADGGRVEESDEDDRFRLPEDPQHVSEDEWDEDSRGSEDDGSERKLVDAYADRVEQWKQVDDEPL